MAINKPSVEDLKKQTPSAYTLVVQVAKRTRELVSGAQPMIEQKDRKPIGVAIEEINRGLITTTPVQEHEDV